MTNPTQKTKQVDRKEMIMDKAVAIFAENGYYKATTALVAKAAGVTQPYVFHFFSSKEELFISVIDRAVTRIAEAFHSAEAPADRLMETMGKAFIQIMETYRDETILVMQAYVISEPKIREHVRTTFSRIHEAVLTKFIKAGIPKPEAAASNFIGTGLLITVSNVLELPQLLCFDC